jgi:hypothetical protein
LHSFLKSEYILEIFDDLIKKNIYNKVYYRKYFFFLKFVKYRYKTLEIYKVGKKKKLFALNLLRVFFESYIYDMRKFILDYKHYLSKSRLPLKELNLKDFTHDYRYLKYFKKIIKLKFIFSKYMYKYLLRFFTNYYKRSKFNIRWAGIKKKIFL